MEMVMVSRKGMMELVLALIIFIAAASAAFGQTKQLLTWQEDLSYVQSLPAADLEQQRDAVATIRTGVEFWLKLHPGTKIQLAPAPPQPWNSEQVRAQASLLRDIVEAIRKEAPGRSFELGVTEISVTAETSPLSPVIDTIDLQEITNLHAMNVAQAIQYLPGISVDHKSARNQSGVMIRGFDTRQVGLYLDGVPIYIPYDGYADIGRFLSSDIAEIDVAKGYSSPLLGPNGLGGTVNLVTRQPEQPFEGDMIIGTGSGNMLQSGVHIGSRFRQFFFRGGMDWLETGFYPISGDFPLNAIQPNYHRTNSDQRDVRYTGRLGWTPREHDQYVFSYTKQKADYAAPPYSGSDPANNKVRYWQWPYWNRESYYLNTNTELGNSNSLKFRGFYDRYPNSMKMFTDSSYSALSGTSAYDDHSEGFSSEFSTRLIPRHVMSASFFYKGDTHKESGVFYNRRGEATIEPWREDHDQLLSMGFQDAITLGERTHATVGFSADHLNATKAENLVDNVVVPFPPPLTDAWAYNPLASLSYTVAKSGSLFVTFALKSHFPTLKDRYSYKNGQAIPNPTLQPEHSRNWTLGYSHAFSFVTMMQIELFRSDVYDAIQNVNIPDSALRQSVNVSKEVHQGVEFTVRSTPTPRLTLNANYSFLNRTITGPSNMLGVFPTGTPKHKTLATATVRLPWSILFLATARYEAGTVTTNDSGRIIPASKFATADLGGIVPIHRGLNLQVGANNLFDRNYYYQEGFPEAGRNWYLNMRYRF